MSSSVEEGAGVKCPDCDGTGQGDPNEGWNYHGYVEPGSIPPCDRCYGTGEPLKLPPPERGTHQGHTRFACPCRCVERRVLPAQSWAEHHAEFKTAYVWSRGES